MLPQNHAECPKTELGAPPQVGLHTPKGGWVPQNRAQCPKAELSASQGVPPALSPLSPQQWGSLVTSVVQWGHFPTEWLWEHNAAIQEWLGGFELLLVLFF